ncbi:MAG: hypothetical protein ACLPSH_10040 [Vulcanimicrobiaceae bacterium]
MTFETAAIAPGNILHDDLILELARRLDLGYGSAVSELMLDRPQVLARKASRALQRPISYIGSNSFGEEIYRVDMLAEPQPQPQAGSEIVPEPPRTNTAAGKAGYSGPFSMLRRLFA